MYCLFSQNFSICSDISMINSISSEKMKFFSSNILKLKIKIQLFNLILEAEENHLNTSRIMVLFNIINLRSVYKDIFSQTYAPTLCNK